MHDFSYKNNKLYAEDVSLQDLANKHGTPLYVYSKKTIERAYHRLHKAFALLNHEVAYAVKANSNLSIIRLLVEIGSSFDIVSGGELYRVIKAGGKASSCTFAGVGKTREEIIYALKEEIYCFNVESESELKFINKLAIEQGVIAPIALRINPNVDAKTHKYISTGKSENKFGIDYDNIEELYKLIDVLPGVKAKGLQMHIGSQLTSVKPFCEALERVSSLVSKLKERYKLEFFSIGGGIGISYDQALASGSADWWEKEGEGNAFITPEKYAKALVSELKELDLKVIMEPGRYLVGNAGVLLTRCLYEKIGRKKTFKVVDGAMNDLIRPALYEGFHEIVPLIESNSESVQTDIVGPVCESGDFFCEGRELQNIKEGDMIAIMSAGAYGFVMASNYNSRPLAAEVLVDGSEAHLIRRRQTYDDLIAQEI